MQADFFSKSFFKIELKKFLFVILSAEKISEKRTKMANKNLQQAKAAKNDEFYTRIEDVSEELRHYKKHFQGKVVFCNCDDPTYSAFWRYFHLNFQALGLKKLISTHYDREKSTYKMEYEGGDDNDVECGVKTPLEGNGDFRNQECLDLMDEADIVVTNPPFSMFRVYIATIIEHEKKFLIIGNQNAITYKEVFPLLKNNDVWIGYNHVKEFYQPDGTIKKFGNIQWFTNLDIDKRHEKLILWKKYSPAEYPRYDNYDAINVDKVANIPMDYCESWEITTKELSYFPKSDWEVVRKGFRADIETVFIIPAAGTALREVLHLHQDGYREKIEKEIEKILKKIYIPCLTDNGEEDTIFRNQEPRTKNQEPAYLALRDRYCNGVLGVPVTFMDKHSPEQFRIVGHEHDICGNGGVGISGGQFEAGGRGLYKRIIIKKIL